MKKMMMAACAAIMLVSCGKEEVAEATTGTTFQKNSDVKMYTWTGKRCIDFRGSCFPEVVVNGKDKTVIDDVFDTIDKGNQSDIKTAFSANQSVLKKYINTQEIDDVIAGNLEVTATDGDSGGSLHYMVFDTSGQTGNPKAVYPFKD